MSCRYSGILSKQSWPPFSFFFLFFFFNYSIVDAKVLCNWLLLAHEVHVVIPGDLHVLLRFLGLRQNFSNSPWMWLARMAWSQFSSPFFVDAFKAELKLYFFNISPPINDFFKERYPQRQHCIATTRGRVWQPNTITTVSASGGSLERLPNQTLASE